MTRFEAHDDLGAIRAFRTRREAVRWLSARPEMRLVVRPKPDPLDEIIPVEN